MKKMKMTLNNIPFISTYMKIDLDKIDENCCTVVAVAICTQRLYADVHKDLSSNGREDNCGLRCDWLAEYLGKHNFKLLPHLFNMSLSKILPALQHGSYLLRTNSHAFAVVDGVVIDWHKPTQAKVKRVYEYTNRNTNKTSNQH